MCEISSRNMQLSTLSTGTWTRIYRTESIHVSRTHARAHDQRLQVFLCDQAASPTVMARALDSRVSCSFTSGSSTVDCCAAATQCQLCNRRGWHVRRFFHPSRLLQGSCSRQLRLRKSTLDLSFDMRRLIYGVYLCAPLPEHSHSASSLPASVSANI